MSGATRHPTSDRAARGARAAGVAARAALGRHDERRRQEVWRRRMRRRRTLPALILTGVLLAAFAAPQPGAADIPSPESVEAARGVIERLQDRLGEVSARADELTVDERYRELEPVVRHTHDLPYVARLTVRSQWKDFTEAERERFLTAFSRSSILSYAERFTGLAENAFRIERAVPTEDGRVIVDAKLAVADRDDVSFRYVLHERDGRWRIVNIVADGVSDLALKRAEYRRILRDGGPGELIEHIEG